MKDTTAILKEAYPLIENGLKKNLSKYKKFLSNYINSNSELLYSNIPSKQIYFSQTNSDEYFKSIGVNPEDIKKAISHTYYYDIANFNPRYAKDETTIALICTVRYFLLHNMKKELDLALINTAFSGKFYSSIWYGSFPIAPAEHIMEYAVTHMTTNKFDIVKAGNVIGAVKSVSQTWVDSYKDRFKDFHDDDVVYVVQQLHSRLRSFMNNIAELYYEAYKNKDYIVYNSDDVSEDNYHIAGSDSQLIDKFTNSTITYINNHDINYRNCKLASNDLVKFEEIKGIIDSIIRNKENVILLKEFIQLILVNYYLDTGKLNIKDIDFISYSISPRPNSKNKYYLRKMELVEKMLINNSENYLRRKGREATKAAYIRSIIAYFALTIQIAN